MLVGRNGAGKSAILEGFEAISSWVVGRPGFRKFDFEIDNTPKKLEIEILTPIDLRLYYRYEFSAILNSECAC